MDVRASVLVCALFVAVAACGEDPAPSQSADPDAGNNGAGDLPDAPDSGDNNGENNGVEPDGGDNNGDNNGATGCQRDADCAVEAGEHCLSDGRCASRYDRACFVDADCRQRERCQDVGGAMACVYQEGPPLICPGAEGCATAEGALEVGASKRAITPPGFEQPLPEYLEDGLLFVGDTEIFDDEVTFVDCGLDQRCEGDPGYPGPDFGEGDGQMQGAWLAGFDHSRPAQRYCADRPDGRCSPDTPWEGALAHDDIWARAVVFRQGELAVGVVVVDTVGYFYDESFAVQEKLAQETDLDLVILASTHNHEAPDTMGQWGPGALGSDLPVQSGADQWWRDWVNQQIAASLDEAWADLRPATLYGTMLNTGVEGMGVQDSRDPWIVDDDLPVLQARDAGTGEVIATVFNWGNHVEALSDGNPWITADYPGQACRFIEEGLPAVMGAEGEELAPAIEGAGGVSVFILGAVGGLTTPLRGALAVNRQGEAWRSGNYEMAEAIGQQLAQKTLEGLEGLEALDLAVGLRAASQEFTMPVDNTQFHTAIFGLNLFDRDLFNATTQVPFSAQNRPAALTRASLVRVGPVTFFTLPGEVFPETLVGGFDPATEYRFTPVMGDPYRPECGPSLLPLTCAAHADCPRDWSCNTARGTCSPAARACAMDGDCAEGAACVEGSCQRACEDAEGCGAGFTCQEGRCAWDRVLALQTQAGYPCLIRPSLENPAPLQDAPQGPYLKERMPGDLLFAVVTGHDELGYIVPTYDFELAQDGAWLLEAPGQHYEETNSVGPDHILMIEARLDALMNLIR